MDIGFRVDIGYNIRHRVFPASAACRRRCFTGFHVRRDRRNNLVGQIEIDPFLTDKNKTARYSGWVSELSCLLFGFLMNAAVLQDQNAFSQIGQAQWDVIGTTA